MDRATKTRLAAFRQNVLAPQARKAAAAPSPAADERPRFTGKHALAGQLRDPRARFRETWGEPDEVNALLLDPLAAPSVKAECRKAAEWYLQHFAAADRAEEAATRDAAALKSVADHLGTTPERMRDPDNAAEMRLRERNALLRNSIADLEAQIREIPEPEAPAE